MKVLLSLVYLSGFLLSFCHGQGLVKIELGDNYEVTLEEAGSFFASPGQLNKTSYYCTFRGEWTRQRHPVAYPDLARWSSPVVFSHSLQYEPWKVGKGITAGVEKMAESGFSDLLVDELDNAGEQALAFSAYKENGVGYYIKDEDDPQYVEYIHLPPVEVNYQYAYLTSVAGMHPSPDWFTGFYNFLVADEYQRTYWDRFVIITYPFDGGTDGGNTYNAVDDDLDPPENCVRITLDNAPNGIYVSPDADAVLPVAEWDCSLVLGDGLVNRPSCDFLKFPNCGRDECVESDMEAAGCRDCDPDIPSCTGDMAYEPNQGRSSAPAAVVGSSTVALMMMITTTITAMFALA